MSKRKSEVEQKESIIKWMDDRNIYNDIWKSVILKYWLSPIQIIKLGYVCKRFLLDLKNMGKLLIIFSTRCKSYGSLSLVDDHVLQDIIMEYNDPDLIYKKLDKNYINKKYCIKTLRFPSMYGDCCDTVLEIELNENITVKSDIIPRNKYRTSQFLLSNKHKFIKYCTKTNSKDKSKIYNNSINLSYYEIYWKKSCPSDQELISNSLNNDFIEHV